MMLWTNCNTYNILISILFLLDLFQGINISSLFIIG